MHARIDPFRSVRVEGPSASVQLSFRSAGGADLREDKMTNSGPGILADFRPLVAHGGPGSLGTGSGSKHSARYAKNQSRRPIIRPVRGYFVFLVPAANG